MATPTRGDIIAALGEVDDVDIAAILGLQATVEDLAEAQAWLTHDETPINDGRRLAGGRVGRLIEILAAMEEPEEDEPAAPPAGP